MNHRPLQQLIFAQQNNRFLALLIALVLLFILYPIVEYSKLGLLGLNLFFMLIIFSAIFAISITRKPLITSIILAILTIVFRWVEFFHPNGLWTIISHTTGGIFWVYIAVHILNFIFRQHKITAEVIYAALAVYFIFGLAWASCYQVLELHNPQSFAIASPETSSQHFIFQMWYFSMVTLTTLGFGDIAPVTMTARVFVVLEAIMGQFYLAVLVANLVGRQISQGK